jgi:hypothetical protein
LLLVGASRYQRSDFQALRECLSQLEKLSRNPDIAEALTRKLLWCPHHEVLVYLSETAESVIVPQELRLRHLIVQ